MFVRYNKYVANPIHSPSNNSYFGIVVTATVFCVMMILIGMTQPPHHYTCTAYTLIQHPSRSRTSSISISSSSSMISTVRMTNWNVANKQSVQSYISTTPATTTATTLRSASVSNTDKPNENSNLSYMERSRIYRRDVFSYDAWVEHRSTDRFIGNLLDILKSGVFRQLLPSCLYTGSIALFVALYNALLVNGYEDFAGLHHDPLLYQYMIPFPILKIPADFFNLCTPSLALLLVFKTNTSYRRWDEGRKNWGAIVNSSRSILREGAAWVHECDTITNEEKQQLMERLEQAVWSFSRSLTRHLLSADEDATDYANDVRAKLRPDLAEDLIAARHKPTRALYEVSAAINEFPIGDQRIVGMDRSTTVLCDAMGSSERIFTSPVPRFFTRHTSRFLELWLVLIPLALYEPFNYCWNHWAMIPATFIITGFLLGIDELALQLEEPFSVLPQHAITNNSIGKVLTESVMWRKTDYDRSLDVQ